MSITEGHHQMHEDYEVPQPEHRFRGFTTAPAPAIKGQLNLALQQAIQEAQSLSTYYDSVAKQLTLLAAQVEHTK